MSVICVRTLEASMDEEQPYPLGQILRRMKTVGVWGQFAVRSGRGRLVLLFRSSEKERVYTPAGSYLGAKIVTKMSDTS